MADMTEGSADLNIVLLGKTGAGKSSTANSLLGEQLFTTSCLANSDTSKCHAASKTIDRRNITVVDTPGYCSTECNDEKLKPEIAKCIIECVPGPHAFLIVLSVRRHTEEEKKAVEEILKMFGEGALKYAIVLFTHGDQLDKNMTIQEFVDKNDHLKTLVQKCGNRFHVIDNKYWNNPTEEPGDERSNAVQIKKLLNTIDQMVKQNGGTHYINKVLQAVEQGIEKEMAEGKTRKNAKQSVMERFLKQVAGVSTGFLMGALLGVPACVYEVAKLLVCSIVNVYTSGGAAAAVVTVRNVVSAASGIGLGAAAGVAGAAACVGGIAGGIAGAKAANEAETAREAAEKAFHDVTKPAEVAANIAMNQMADTMKKCYKKVSYSP